MDQFWQSRRVLVTGAAGFTGYNLALTLARQGAIVRAFVRSGGSAREFPEDIEVFVGDQHIGGAVAQVRAGRAHVWDVDLDSWAQNACEAAGRGLTRDEWATYEGP